MATGHRQFWSWASCFIMAIDICALAPLSAQAEVRDGEDMERRTLQAALKIAGLSFEGLPITLAEARPENASKGVEGWTTFGSDYKGERIFVFTGSKTFLCAKRTEDPHCLVKLASVIVHEAWHFRHGVNEAEAYAVQLMFLTGNSAPSDLLADVQLARDRTVAAGRKTLDAARRRAGQPAH